MGKENRESKPDRKVRPDQTPTHTPMPYFPPWRHRPVSVSSTPCNLKLLLLLAPMSAPQACIRWYDLLFLLGPTSPVCGRVAEWFDGCVRPAACK